jgi:hypothetical protein
MPAGDVSAFVDYALELDEAAAGSGLTWLKARRDEAAELITGLGSSKFIQTTIDGQSFTRTVELTSMEMFSLLQDAIRVYNGNNSRLTFGDFDGIQH